MTAISFIGVNVGNTRSQIGRFERGGLVETERLPNDNLAAIVDSIVRHHRALGSDAGDAPIVVASVNPIMSDRLQSAARDQLHVDFYRVGEDLPPAVSLALDPETITGVDRLLNAAGAFARVKQACVVIDAGTAVTVDFVDGEGTFHGGAIAPGAAMQLRALHERTAALPNVEFAKPRDEDFGRSTAQAMLQGVYYGIRGMVWRLVERYAERYGAYPQVVATGGDAAVLFAEDELIDNIVPDLTLIGLGESVKNALGDDGNDDDADLQSRRIGR